MALSKAVRDGRLCAGVALDRGRVVVTDIEAAIACWHTVHVDRIDYATRIDHAAKRQLRKPVSPPAPHALATHVWSESEMRDQVEALDLVARVFVADALERMPPSACFERFAGRMPAAGYGFGDDAQIRAAAERALAELIDEVVNPLESSGDEAQSEAAASFGPSGDRT